MRGYLDLLLTHAGTPEAYLPEGRLHTPLLPRLYRVMPHERIAKFLLEAAITALSAKHIIESETLIGAS